MPSPSDAPLGASRRVVVTGAAGRIGRATAPLLPSAWGVQLTDLRPGAPPGSGLDVEALDVTDEAACRSAFEGADAVVHLAGVPDPAATWEQLLPANVIGTHAVAAAAVAAGVRRLVVCSSLQAVSAPPAVHQVRSEDPPRPTNLYGATKGWAELVGSWVAATSSTSVVALRIGYFNEQPPPWPGTTPRDKAAWLSVRDAAELLRAAVEADLREVDGTPVGHGAGFVVVNGISAGRYRKADLSTTHRVLGYRPLDDAWAGEPLP
ncbi:uronate dehydrogenase [Quadrisphaera granulorum]|uniref:Uronate dehydrogenase n=1 Tax=Quadrisphaera granulorum TaxID=317664 RepID=A0A315ZL89_9ACTN|nr:NAD(P)-dependent oxidoreductase [Quadrisphaera granulorum]PWJ46311.1 uronate dehydrogenase [Quadrisphaera granulorum]SZE99072.1 uronate dehydrogenase [Quadrisphaera granulorum]